MVKEEKIDIEKKIIVGGAITLVVFMLLLLGLIIGNAMADISLTQEVADDICQQLTNESTAVASNEHPRELFVEGKLVCTIPSFDATQNIIVKRNNK